MERQIPTVGRNILVRRGQEVTTGIVTAVYPRVSASKSPYRIGVAIQPNTEIGGIGWGRVEFEEMDLLEDADDQPKSPTVFASWMPYQTQKAAETTKAEPKKEASK